MPSSPLFEAFWSVLRCSALFSNCTLLSTKMALTVLKAESCEFDPKVTFLVCSCLCSNYTFLCSKWPWLCSRRKAANLTQKLTFTIVFCFVPLCTINGTGSTVISTGLRATRCVSTQCLAKCSVREWCSRTTLTNAFYFTSQLNSKAAWESLY